MKLEARKPNCMLVLVAIVVWFLAATLPQIPARADTNTGKEMTIDLGFLVDSLTFLSDERTVLMISNKERRVVLFDLKESKIMNEFSYQSLVAERLFFDETLVYEVFLSDVTIGPKARYAYLIGLYDWITTEGVLVRLDLNTFKRRIIRFSDELFSPSVAVDADGRLFIGDLNFSTITVVDGRRLFKSNSYWLTRHYRPDHSIYLKRGAAIDVGVSQVGGFIFASHDQVGKISLIDAETADVIDEIGPGGTVPLAMVVTTSLDRSRTDPRTSIIIGDFETDVLVVSDLDTDFRSFAKLVIAPLGLQTKKKTARANKTVKSPLILSADTNHRTIVVGNRYGNRAVSFSRIGNSLERRNVLFLQNPPIDIDVSPNGRILVILNSDRSSLKIIRNPTELVTETSVTFGSKRIREAQRALSQLGYPVGVIDGFDGPNTRRAVSLFQRDQKLKPSGTIDEETLQRIREAVVQRPQSSEIHKIQ